MRILQIDAFADRPFAGNPAAVCLLHENHDVGWMQALAGEMNLSETAFVRPLDEGYDLRWFTPVSEVELCGHATLAAAHALWSERLVARNRPIQFHTRSGVLTCQRSADVIELDFPATPVQESAPAPELLGALGVQPTFTGASKYDQFLVVESEDIVCSLQPDFGRLKQVSMRGVIVTSRADDPQFDFVSRYFAPAFGIDEDPVTGSAHCSLGPYWARRLGKSKMLARQASQRGGIVQVGVQGDRVMLGGRAVTVWKGDLSDPPLRCRSTDQIEASRLKCRQATVDDVPILARMNKKLIEDERSRNSLSVSQLEARLRTWLEGDWQAALFDLDDEPIAYILFQFRTDEYTLAADTVYIRQFFVERHMRSAGVGRMAFELAAGQLFPNARQRVLDVLELNPAAIRFWKAVGFEPYCTTLKQIVEE